MSDNEIIKALECCSKKICKQCPNFSEDIECSEKLINLTLDLINRLQADKDDLFYKLVGVMHSVDKWLDGDELKQDEVNRAATMREKTLQIFESLQAENERLKAENKLLIDNDVSNKYPNCVLVEKGRIYTRTLEDYDKLIGDISAEAYKEFAERLKTEYAKGMSWFKKKESYYVDVSDIDNLLKELVGENNAR